MDLDQHKSEYIMTNMAFWVDCSFIKSKPALLLTAKVKFQVKSDYFSKGFPINSVIRSQILLEA